MKESLSRAILRAKRQGSVPLIADIKPVSPRDGPLMGSRDPASVARRLVAAGACAISVVTEPVHFGGDLETLRAVCAAVPVPVLQKDFFLSADQIDASHACGAQAVLVILATTPDDLAFELCLRARERGLEAVVEIHTEKELERAMRLEPTIIGINNRDIRALERDAGDVRTTEAIAPLVANGIVTISESALLDESAIRRALRAGADAVLVGTAILQAPDPAGLVRGIVEKGSSWSV
jgi:indole-3-glycerol phosphate synthase